MTGEPVADPYLARRRNEEGYFEIFWALRCQKTWERSRIPSDSVKPPLGWGDGHKEVAREGWMARASLSVVGSTDSGGSEHD